MSVFSNNLKEYRIFRGVSQRELAMALNKTSAVICNWEKGINSPDLASLETICKVLMITPNQLFGWDNNAEYEQYKNQKEKYIKELDRLTRAKAEIEKQIDLITLHLSKGGSI